MSNPLSIHTPVQVIDATDPYHGARGEVVIRTLRADEDGNVYWCYRILLDGTICPEQWFSRQALFPEVGDDSEEEDKSASLARLVNETHWTEETARTLIDAYIQQGYTPDAAVNAILEEEQRATLALEEDEDSEEEDDSTPFAERDAAERLEVAEAALEHMSEEWLQNAFGSDQTDVIFDALNLYVEYHSDPVGFMRARLGSM